VENKERERKGGETGGRGEGRVIGDSRFSIPTAWGGGEGPTQRIRSSATSLVSLPRAVCCLNTLAVGNPSHLLCILRVKLDMGLGGGWG
jgi:hypothetical protein